ncbi:hypothetical protein GGS24DRAFT_497116 [Hypoxylon argillaceum]|nr:hypothetical protein GGS24DRAFT_497116 [Hypoxylon argillaceum]
MLSSVEPFPIWIKVGADLLVGLEVGVLERCPPDNLVWRGGETDTSPSGPVDLVTLITRQPSGNAEVPLALEGCVDLHTEEGHVGGLEDHESSVMHFIIACQEWIDVKSNRGFQLASSTGTLVPSAQATATGSRRDDACSLVSLPIEAHDHVKTPLVRVRGPGPTIFPAEPSASSDSYCDVCVSPSRPVGKLLSYYRKTLAPRHSAIVLCAERVVSHALRIKPPLTCTVFSLVQQACHPQSVFCAWVSVEAATFAAARSYGHSQLGTLVVARHSDCLVPLVVRVILGDTDGVDRDEEDAKPSSHNASVTEQGWHGVLVIQRAVFTRRCSREVAGGENAGLLGECVPSMAQRNLLTDVTGADVEDVSVDGLPALDPEVYPGWRSKRAERDQPP